MQKIFFGAIGSLTLIFFGFVVVAFAASEADIHFPVAELGNCANKQECKAYCNAPEHIEACVAFGKAHHLITKQEADRGEKFAKIAAQAGPGGCHGQDECQAYCEDVSHIQECVAFGEERGLLSGQDLNQAKKFAQALKRGVKPPSGCTSKQTCEAYCSEEGHFDECIAFGREAGFISDDEYKIAKETQGKGPGDCRGKDACEAYCQDENHIKECVDFGRKHGFISEKEADIAIKTGGKGPGGCRKDECKTYCEDPSHQDECMHFAKEHGLISEDQIKQMEEGKNKFLESLAKAPSEVQACVRDLVGPDFSKQAGIGDIQKTPELARQIRACFEKQKNGENQFQGPGGCTGREECKAYCSEPAHASECKRFFQEKIKERPQFNTPPVPKNNEEVQSKRKNNTTEEDREQPADGNHENANEEGEICAEVITPARDPQTGACHEFPTPCAVPPGWEEIDECDEKSSDVNVVPPLRGPEQGAPPAFHGPGGCATQAECEAYCKAHPSECGIHLPDQSVPQPLPQQQSAPHGFDSSLAPLQSLGAMALQVFFFLAGR